MLLKPLLKPLTGAVPLAQYPLTLFAQGEQGIWLDPSDRSTLFQDAAGTVPVELDGDPVGLVLDKSGNGNHASQPISASRPTYRTDGILHWLEFDGIDDYLVTGFIDFSTLSAASLFFGLNKASDLSTAILCELSENSDINNGAFSVFAPSSSGINKFLFRVRGTTIKEIKTTSSDYNAPITVVLNSSVDISSDAISMKLSSVEAADIAGALGSGNLGSYPLYIGSRGGSSFRFSGSLYGLCINGTTVTQQDTYTVDRYMARKSGVTL